MQYVPIQSTPSQTIKAVLGGQNCQIALYAKTQGLFVDINADGVEIVSGVIARDAVPLLARGYTGFIGNLLFVDTQGASDPQYSGLGSRFNLIYLTDVEYALI
jgi:hypothetical protein